MRNLRTISEGQAATEPSMQLTTDAVVAAYIHEISERHRPTDEAAAPATEAGGRD